MKFQNKILTIKQKIACKCDKAFLVAEHVGFGLIISSAIYLLVIKKAVRSSKCEKQK